MNTTHAATIPTEREQRDLAAMSKQALKNEAARAIAGHHQEAFDLINWELRRRRAAR